MGKTFSRALMLAVATGGLIAPAALAEGEFSGNVALTTDYIFRGFTQTNGGPAIQGGFDYADDSFYVGTWASAIDYDGGAADGTSIEVDLYAGWTPSAAGIDFDLGFIYYLYPDAPDEPEQNFVEVYAGGSTTLGILDIGASYAYSPEYYGETGSTGYLAASVGTALGENFGIDATVGFLDYYDDGPMDACPDCDGTDYSIGLTTSISDYVDLDFRFIDSDYDGTDEAYVVTVSRAL